MEGTVKKFYSCGILLILLLTAALTIFAGCDSYEYERADGFKIYTARRKGPPYLQNTNGTAI